MDMRCFVIVFATHLLPLSAITVPLCPTNKIAPHRRAASVSGPRTFGSFSELFSGADAAQGSGSLVEAVEEDNEDCGFIEDYDENDLSSLTPQTHRRGHSDSRFFFGPFGSRPPQNPVRPGSQPSYPVNQPSYPVNQPSYPVNQPSYPVNQPSYPVNQPGYPVNQPSYPVNQPSYPVNQPGYPVNQPSYPVRPPRPTKPQYTTQRPSRPSRPPYFSGGHFGGNAYRPPLNEQPSPSLKPVYEDTQEESVTYRPSIVGGSLGHVVGVTPARPTSGGQTYPARPTPGGQAYPGAGVNRPRGLYSNSILGSFVDLFLK